MAGNKLHLKIVTPREIKVDSNVDMVIIRCKSGDMGIMADHEPRSAALDVGVMRIVDENGERRIAVHGGIAEMKDNVLTIMTRAAEWPEEINRERAEHEREHFEHRIHDQTDDLELQSDQVALRRALVRIEVSSYVFVGGSKKTE